MIKEIFVDETLLKIDGQDYWLWIAYEPNLKSCVMMHIYQEKGQFLFVINSSDSWGIGMVVEKHLHRWCDMVLMMLVNGSGWNTMSMILGLRTDGKICTTDKR